MNHLSFIAQQTADVINRADPSKLVELAAVRTLIADAGIQPAWSPALAPAADDSTTEAWLAAIAHCIDRSLWHAMDDILAAVPPTVVR